MEKIKCEVCGSIDIKQLNYMPCYRNYVLMNCFACGLKFILSDNLEVLDDDSYWDRVNKSIYVMPSVLKEFKKKHNKYLEIIKNLNPPSYKLLDVGCGNGIFLTNSVKHNFDATGIEPSIIAAELCKKHYGITPHIGYLEIDSDLPKDYGILTAWDVIEHVASPTRFLKSCYAHLQKDGILLLETPDESSIVRKFINILDNAKRALKINSDSNIYYPSHRYYFTHKAIRRLLNDVGFSNVKIYKEHSIYSKSKAKYKFYKKYTNIQMIKYDLIFFILKFPLFWNKQVVLCIKR